VSMTAPMTMGFPAAAELVCAAALAASAQAATATTTSAVRARVMDDIPSPLMP
jgi:hypothetical protein